MANREVGSTREASLSESLAEAPPSFLRKTCQFFFSQSYFWPLVLGIAISIAVCLPFFLGGRLFLLDWVLGPKSAAVSTAALGLNGGLTAGIPASVGAGFLNSLLGGSVTWLPIFLFFPLATVSAASLAGRSLWSRLAAGSLYAVNPFVFNRVYVGHVAFFIGYGLLPFAVKAVRRLPRADSVRWLSVGIWWTVLIALSPHFVWIFGLVVVAVAVVSLSRSPFLLRRLASRLMVLIGVVVLTSSYIWLPSQSSNLSNTTGATSLELYHTTGDAHLGLFGNVLGLYGFWRTGPGPELPKQVEAGWPFLLLGILLVVAVGLIEGFRRPTISEVEENGEVGISRASRVNDEAEFRAQRDEDRRSLTLTLVFVGVIGYFLALGNQGPTRWLFTFAYEHVPFFDIMREPQKFLMLSALAYAVFFGWGVERVSGVSLHNAGKGAVSGALALGIALPLAYTPNIFDGLAGQIKTSTIPASYEKADRLMGNGPGQVLALPWHLYESYYFTNNRVINNLAPTVNDRNVISGDDVQSSGVETQSTLARSYYLQNLYSEGSTLRDFGKLIAPLGVEYVELSKTVDWTSYLWLNHQSDLQLIVNAPTLKVWRNTSYRGVGYRVDNVEAAATTGELIRESKESNFLGFAQVKARASADAGLTVFPGASRSVTELSPVAYRIGAGPAGWVVVDAAYQKGWSLNARPARATAEGTLLVRVGSKPADLVFTPWRQVRLGYELTAGVLLAAVFLLAFDKRRSRRRVSPRAEFT